jgi:hypothetical protein
MRGGQSETNVPFTVSLVLRKHHEDAHAVACCHYVEQCVQKFGCTASIYIAISIT